MPTEIEAKFLRVDHDAIRERLRAAGAELEHPTRLMRRVLFDYPDGHLRDTHQMIRVRDEQDATTLTYKHRKAGVAYAEELEVKVDDYQTTVAILRTLGLDVYSYQESKRETWYLADVEIVLDEWPWLPTYIEIEGPTEEAIQATAEQLGFQWEQAYFGSVSTAYREAYPGMTEADTVNDIAEIRFNDPVPKYLQRRQP